MAESDSASVLVVDDSQAMLFVHEDALKRAGYRVTTARSGEAALRLVSEGRLFDLILMDLELGAGKDGVETAREILAIKPVPVLFLSSHIDPEFVEQTKTVASYGYVVKTSGTAVMLASVSMALRLHQSQNLQARQQRELDESHARYRELFDNIHSGVAVYQAVNGGEDFIFKDFNRAGELMDKQSRNDLIGKSLLEMRPGIAEFGLLDVFRRVYRTGIPENHPVTLYQDSMLSGWYENNVYRLPSGEIVAVFSDLTTQKKAELALQDSNFRLQSILEGTNAGTWEWNVQTGQTIFNDIWAHLLGYELSELEPISIKTWENLTHPDDLLNAEHRLNLHFEGKEPFYTAEFRMKHKDGSWRWIFDRGKVISRTESGKPLLMFGTHMEITERKKLEFELRRQLEEKEILLREVHHRIKNNIASIMSLLSLQEQNIANPEAKAALVEAQGRMRSMHLLYEQLLLRGDVQELSVKDFLDKLIANIVQVYSPDGSISFSPDIDDFPLAAEQVFPLGVMLNELVTNAVKYAFENTSNPLVKVALKRQGSCRELTVIDNGKGLPEGFDLAKSRGLGLMLVKMLARQLDATLEIANDEQGGTLCRVVFHCACGLE